ncbi:MAG TPA: hypothetical protein VFD58_16515, partial [Blastocatellia bacterium]|nr:hypothetical protein [Blastocatellia bacterium]
LTVQTPGDAGYGIQHRSNSVSLSSFIGVGGSSLGGWFGTRSNHPLYFFTNDGGPQMSLLQSGNVGIGTTAPGASLDVRGTRLRLQTDSGNNGPYLLLTHAGEASGHTYAIGSSGGANGPGAGSFEIYDSTAAQSRLLINPSGHITQARDKGGMIKAMVFVEGNGFISRCYNSQMADGGASLPPSGYTGCGFTVTPNFEGGSATYNINFGFQVSDRFASVTGARSGIYAASANVIYLPTTTNELGVETHIALTGEYAPASFTVILF